MAISFSIMRPLDPWRSTLHLNGEPPVTTNHKNTQNRKVGMRLRLTLAAALLVVFQIPTPTISKEILESNLELPRSSPEAQGISSSAIHAFVDEADQKIDHLHSFILVRHGHVVAEGWWSPYNASARHELYSLSKSFTSSAVGLAVHEGKLSLDDPVTKFFAEEAPGNPSANLKAMRVRDLLCMSTGHQSEPRLAALPSPTATEPKQEVQTWVKTFLGQPVSHKPGTHFLYNTAATYMLSAIVQKVTGQTVLDYLRPRLFQPLGIENPTWGTSPQGITLGGYGLSIRTEDIARFGQLYLQRGNWQGRQLIPATWVELATSRQTSNGSNPNSDWDQGYGFQFWRSRNGAYRGDGAFGQFCIVMPEQDAVVAITSGVKDMQAVLNLVWDRLLPAMKHDPLPPDSEGERGLKGKLASLSMPVQKGIPTSHFPDVAGKKFTFSSNNQKVEMLGLEFGREGTPVTLVGKFNGGVEQRISCGNGEWKKGTIAFGMFPDRPAAVCGAWTTDDSYTARICFCETPFVLTITLQFSQNNLQFDPTWNVGFGPSKPGQLIGQLE
jgi:CubicO group peptidase (beta-lactamase class C family)